MTAHPAVKLLTRKEAAVMLGVSLPTLDADRADGHLSYIQRRPGGKVWIPEDAISEYLERMTHKAKPVINLGKATYRKRRA